MIVQPKMPCRVRYQRRVHSGVTSPAKKEESAEASCPFHAGRSPSAFEVRVDRQLCQGHSVCVGEAPALFELDAEGHAVVKTQNISASLLEKARKAEQYCPNKAIQVIVKSA